MGAILARGHVARFARGLQASGSRLRPETIDATSWKGIAVALQQLPPQPSKTEA
jgi:hypothetical protein